MRLKIRSTGQIYDIDDKDIKPGTEVLVESEGVIEPAVILCTKNCPEINVNPGIVNFHRVFTEEDFEIRRKLKEKVKVYLNKAGDKIFRHGLEMKILDVDMSFDEKKLTFYFSAEGRIDFRALVSDMAGEFGKIIRLQQVGSREEAKHFGGFGKCGRPLCCATFLNNLENITLNMAELQDLSGAKSSKLAGCCGKLMCCMSYEADLYKESRDKLPKIGSVFKSNEIEGKVVGHNILEGKAVIETSDGKKTEVIV